MCVCEKLNWSLCACVCACIDVVICKGVCSSQQQCSFALQDLYNIIAESVPDQESAIRVDTVIHIYTMQGVTVYKR